MDTPGVSRVSGTRQESTETKRSTKTSELIVFLVGAAAVLLAALVVDGFNAT